MARTASSKATGIAQSTRRRTSTRAHRDFDKSFTNNNLIRAGSTPADDDDELDSSVEDEREAVETMSADEKRRMLERKAALLAHEWVGNDDFGPHHVKCAGCSKVIHLDRRQHYYPAMWHKHVFRCAIIRDHFFKRGMDMPVESLIAELGKVKAQEITDGRSNGVIFPLTSAPDQKLRRPKTTARSSTAKHKTRTVNTRDRRTTSTSFSTDSASVSSSSSSSSSSFSPAPSTPPPPPPPPPHNNNDLDDVPFHETLAYKIGVELSRQYGWEFCCGEWRPAEHKFRDHYIFA